MKLFKYANPKRSITRVGGHLVGFGVLVRLNLVG